MEKVPDPAGKKSTDPTGSGFSSLARLKRISFQCPLFQFSSSLCLYICFFAFLFSFLVFVCFYAFCSSLYLFLLSASFFLSLTFFHFFIFILGSNEFRSFASQCLLFRRFEFRNKAKDIAYTCKYFGVSSLGIKLLTLENINFK